MTAGKTNLESLGARRLAELLIRISTRDRRVGPARLELAGAKGSATAALEVRKRMAGARRSRWFVDWDESPALADELDTMRQAIVEHVAKADATEALDLMWSFMELADSVYERCDDSGGTVGNVFQAAWRPGEMPKAKRPAHWADRPWSNQ